MMSSISWEKVGKILLAISQAMEIKKSEYFNNKTGRDDWTRTSDLLTPSQTRYQTALRPDYHQLQTILILIFANTNSICRTIDEASLAIEIR